MLMSNFSGGLSRRLAPNLIEPSESIECTNVDLTSGSLKPLKGLSATLFTVPTNKNSFTIFKGAYIKEPQGTTFVEFNDSLYIADAVGTIRKTRNGINFNELGLNKPVGALTLSTSFKFEYTLSNNLVGDASTIVSDKNYEYLIQYRTDTGSIDYIETTFNYTGTQGIQFTLPNLTSLKSVTLYRKYDTKYRLIGELVDELTLKDTVKDLSTRLSTTPYREKLGSRNYIYTYYSSLTGIESAPSAFPDSLDVDINNVTISGFVPSAENTVDTIRLYRLGGTLTDYFLVASLPVSTLIYNDTKSDLKVLEEGVLLESKGFIKPKAGIRFLTEFNSALFGSVGSTLYFSNPGLVDNWTDFNFIEFPEPITGLGATQNGLLVFSRNKTYIIVGEDLSTYSKQLLNGSQGCISHSTINYVSNNLIWQSLDGLCMSLGSNIELLSWPKLGKISLNPIKAQVYDNTYYLFHTTGTLIVDFRQGVKFSESTIIARGAYYSPEFDKLYILKPGDVGVYEFGEGTDLTYAYKTGWLHEGKLTNRKSYKKVYIYSKGLNSIEFFANGISILTVTLNQGLNEINLPQISSKAYHIEFRLTGSGEVYEIDFTVEGRQNGI